MHRLSSAIEDLQPHYDVVVIGSGYGGGVAASRMARAGRSVCLLERGLERHPGEYPETLLDARSEIQIDTAAGHLGTQTAMFDVRINADLDVLVGCGLGGTSLINANVSLPPDPVILDDERWPAALRADRETGLAVEVARAAAMLRPVTYSDAMPSLNKMAAHEKSARLMGQPFHRVPINVTFEEGTNHVGVHQRPCTLCGDCVTGCNESAKNTTLMNYLPDAWNHGAAIFTGTRVRHLARQGEAWAVHFSTAEGGRERFHDTMLSVAADIVIVAAGTLGSTEILLRSRARGLPMSPAVGTRFSGNGDVLGFAYSTLDRIDGISTGPRPLPSNVPIGPCITSVIDIRTPGDAENGLIIEEGSVPAALARLLTVPLSVTGDVAVASTGDVGIADVVRRKIAEAQSATAGAGAGALAHTQTFLVMSHDGSDGRLYLEDDRLRVDWPDVGTRPVFDRVNEQLEAAARALGGVFIRNPARTPSSPHGLVTVHPLGGCAMADDAGAGVVNHKGQVFADPAGTSVHENLYVMDGAIIPRSLGVNPLLTITALAERSCALIAADRGWHIDYTLPSSPTRRIERSRPGLEFTERMSGFFSTSVLDDCEQAAEHGARQGTTCDFVLTVATADLESMLADPEHRAVLYGTVRASELSPDPMTVVDGRFSLFSEDEADVHAHRMQYRMRLQATDGRTFAFEGVKWIRDGRLWDVWPATTTLFVTVRSGDENGPVTGRGILRIAPADFARQLTTLQVRNAPNAVVRARLLGRFGRLFAGRVWEHFGGALATNPVAGDRAVVRQKRPLEAPHPDVHFFETGDGTDLRLVRYNGGPKGPLICAPGFSNTSQVFAWDGIGTNWVEFAAGHGYDVWLLDYRASPDVPASRTQFTLDQVAYHDWPAAVDYVRNATGCESVQALGHCLGSATGFMALLSGRLSNVRQFVASQVMPFVDVSSLARLKAGLRLDRLFSRLGVAGVETDAGRSTVEKMVDRLLRVSPMPAEWQTLGPVCRRIYAIYGPVMNPAQINRDTRDALDWIFGYGNLTSFAHIRQFIRNGRLVDAAGADVYVPNIGRLTTHVVLVQGRENELFLAEGSARTEQWIREHHGPGSCMRLVIPDYAHLDCFIGRSAARDVFPLLVHELDRLN